VLRDRLDGPLAEVVRSAFRIDADDCLLAIDADTGRTRWHAIERRNGMNHFTGKRGHWAVAPTYSAGRVFSVGTTGRLYAYDAKTGKRLWESNIGPWHEMAEEIKAWKLGGSKREGAPGGGHNLSAKRNGLAVADGVLIVPTFSRGGLRGVDPASGKVLWELSDAVGSHATPSIWRHKGREYLITSPRDGLKLIDPRNGDVLWTQPTGTYYGCLTVSDTHVVTNVRDVDKGRGLWGAYRLSLDGAKLAWQLPNHPKYYCACKPDAGAHRRVAIVDGLVILQGRRVQEQNLPGRLLVIRESDGKIEMEKEDEGGSQPIVMEDRVVFQKDIAHGDSAAHAKGVSLYQLSGSQLLPLGTVKYQHSQITGYELPIQTPYYRGRLFFRSRNGLACYDFRQVDHVDTVRLHLTNVRLGLPDNDATVVVRIIDGQLADAAVKWPGHMERGPHWHAASWTKFVPRDLTWKSGRLGGNLVMPWGHDRESWPLKLLQDGDKLTGQFERKIAPLPKSLEVKGEITGKVERIGDATQRWTISLADAIGPPSSLAEGKTDAPSHLIVDRTGDDTRLAFGQAGQVAASIHEVDASALEFDGDRVTGTVHVIYHNDRWVRLYPKTGQPIAARYEIDVTRTGDTLTGHHTGVVGVEHVTAVAITGEYRRDEDIE
jgi:outer membrane protein assembly factor BamB